MSRPKKKRIAKQKSTANTAIEQAYRELTSIVQRAQAVTPANQSVNLTEAGRFLDTHPQLIDYLQAVQQRQEARQDAMSRVDLTAKGSPTGAYPQSQSSAFSGWAGNNKNNPIGVPNARLLRDWADTNEWVRAAINVRRQQVERADIVVMPLDETKPYNKSLLNTIQQILDQPNEIRDSWRSLIGPVIEDILVLDRGVISKNMTPARKPVALYYEDGANIKIFPMWSGDPDEPRYLYEEPGGAVKKPLRNDELIVIMANVASYRYGLSPVQVLRNTIIADLEASKSAARLVSMKPPPTALQLVGATDTQIRNFISAYDNDIAGKKELFVFGGKEAAQHFPLVFSAKDMQWLDWQQYMAIKICAILQISPQQLGLTNDINKATAGMQQQVFEDTGLIPLLLLVEEYLNREFLADFAPQLNAQHSNIAALNLRIVFPELSETARQMHSEKINQLAQTSLAGLPSMTLNQILAARGEEPVPGGNTFWIKTATGAVPWLSYDNELGDYGSQATSGELGSQDPAGGINADEDTPSTLQDQDDAPDDTSSSSDSADQNQATSTGGVAPVQDPPAEATKQIHPHTISRDARLPGKKWSASIAHQVAKAQTSLLDTDEQHILQKSIERIFKDAAQRGKNALKEKL